MNDTSLGSPDLPVFVKVNILNITPPSQKTLYLKFRACKSQDLFAFDNGNNIANFFDNSLRDKTGGILSM